MLQAVNEIIDVPLIASGGCGNIQHIEDVLKEDAHARMPLLRPASSIMGNTPWERSKTIFLPMAFQSG